MANIKEKSVKSKEIRRYPPERLTSGRAWIPALVDESMAKHGVTGVPPKRR
jgi:hypothetical protein